MAKVPLIPNDYGAIPGKPAFKIGWLGAMDLTSTPIVPPTGGTVKFNVGSHFNPSTMKFTCPVAGTYLMGCSYLRNSGTNAVVRANFYKDNVNQNQQLRGSEAFTGYNYTAGQWWVIIAEAGSVLELRISSDTATSLYSDGGNADYNWISGFLVG